MPRQKEKPEEGLRSVLLRPMAPVAVQHPGGRGSGERRQRERLEKRTLPQFRETPWPVLASRWAEAARRVLVCFTKTRNPESPNPLAPNAGGGDRAGATCSGFSPPPSGHGGLHRVGDGAQLEAADVLVPVLLAGDDGGVSLVSDALAGGDRVSGDGALLRLGLAGVAREVALVGLGPALRAGPQAEALLHGLVHGEGQHPVAHLLAAVLVEKVALGEVELVGDVGVHKVRVLDGKALGVVYGLAQVQISVEEDESHVELAGSLPGGAGLVKGLVGRHHADVAEKGGGGLGGHGVPALVGAHHKLVGEVGGLVEAPEGAQLLHVDVRRGLHMLHQLLQVVACVRVSVHRRPRAHRGVRLADHAAPHVAVEVEVGGVRGHPVAGQHRGRCPEVPLLGPHLGVAQRVAGHHLGALLGRQLVHALPLALLGVALDSLA
mmetsp:Transcript_23594/g.65437  ORF Transcript_23594/g.65437 Transcript_23594/m.65437 type:complete len:435 (+) Transcript_23594:79-1383(+)